MKVGVVLLFALSLVAVVPARGAAAPASWVVGENERVVHVVGTPFTHEYYVPRLETLLLERYAHQGLTYRRVAVTGALQDLLNDLDRRVLVHRPTLVILQAGNDDLYSQRRRPAFDFDAYPKVLEALVKTLRERNIRVVLCSVVPVGNGSTREHLRPPLDGLQGWVTAARAIAERHGAAFVDLFTEAIGWEGIGTGKYFRNYYSIQEQERSWQILQRQLPFAAAEARVRIDARGGPAQSQGANVADLRAAPTRVSFTLQPAAEAGTLMLAVEGLPAGRYAVEVDGQRLEARSSQELAAGIDLRASFRSRAGTPEFRAELQRGHTMTASAEAIRAYRLPDWTRVPDFAQQQQAALQRALATLAQHDAAAREMVRPPAMAVRIAAE